MNAETLKDLLANATPGIRDVSRIGYVHIGGVMYPHVDQTRHEAESWIDMRHRVQLELDKAEAECVANAKLESLSYVLAADNIALQAEVERLRDLLSKCVGILDATIEESKRGIECGEEDPFRMGEWFEEDDLSTLISARAALHETPDTAGGDDGY